MNYYIDTEFLEGTQKEKFPISLFRKETAPTIDLISIGIVAEDGREYYAISKDFNLEEAWNRFDLKETLIPLNKPLKEGPGVKKVYWIRENVLKPIWRDLFFKSDDCLGLSNKQIEEYLQFVNSGGFDKLFTFKSLKAWINRYGKTNKEIAEDIIAFTEPINRYYSLEGEKRFTHGSVAVGTTVPIEDITKHNLIYHYPRTSPKFYAYYADYDWVAFCWLFGKMMDLPKGFPMYCNDLKQLMEEKIQYWINQHKLLGTENFKMNYDILKEHIHYPKQENEHNALDDARWNKKLHEFLNTL